MFKNNRHKYSVSAMYSVLQLSGSTFYYEARQRPSVNDVTEAIREIFRRSRENYGTRKIKTKL